MCSENEIYLKQTICRMYGEGNEFITMNYLAREFDLTKNDVINTIHFCIQNNLISDELTERIIKKVLKKSYYSSYVKSAYDESLKIREQNKILNSPECLKLRAEIEYYEHTLSIFDSDFSEADGFYRYKSTVKRKLDKLKSDLDAQIYYSSLSDEELESLCIC